MSVIKIDLGELENSCFVVMPFSPLYQTEYEKVIQPTLEELDIKCIRGDQIYTQQRIMDDIWGSIRSCRFIIAELTGRNPNVLYEVGLAHAIGKPVIIMTRNEEDVPFDLKNLRYLFYDINDPYWGENLKKGLKSLIQKVIENPSIENYLSGISKIDKSEFPKITHKVVQKKSAAKGEIIDIAGEWTGSWDVNGNKHTLTMQLSQDNDEVTATANISYFLDKVITVVQQIMTGKIVGLRLRLLGVNYSFIERGAEPEDYLMDTFDLKYDPKKDTLSGTSVDELNSSSEITLKRGVYKMKDF